MTKMTTLEKIMSCVASYSIKTTLYDFPPNKPEVIEITLALKEGCHPQFVGHHFYGLLSPYINDDPPKL